MQENCWTWSHVQAISIPSDCPGAIGICQSARVGREAQGVGSLPPGQKAFGCVMRWITCKDDSWALRSRAQSEYSSCEGFQAPAADDREVHVSDSVEGGEHLVRHRSG
jgi:hypothetical protein